MCPFPSAAPWHTYTGHGIGRCVMSVDKLFRLGDKMLQVRTCTQVTSVGSSDADTQQRHFWPPVCTVLIISYYAECRLGSGCCHTAIVWFCPLSHGRTKSVRSDPCLLWLSALNNGGLVLIFPVALWLYKGCPSCPFTPPPGTLTLGIAWHRLP